MENDFNAVCEAQPTEALCNKSITVDVVGDRCIYLNNHRIVGSKPYYSENLPQRSTKLTVRDALAAFSVDEMSAYINEKTARQKYFSDYREKRDANKASKESSDGK